MPTIANGKISFEVKFVQSNFYTFYNILSIVSPNKVTMCMCYWNSTYMYFTPE